MLYLFQIYALVAGTVFGLWGVLILILFVWFQLKALVKALASRIAISRAPSPQNITLNPN